MRPTVSGGPSKLIGETPVDFAEELKNIPHADERHFALG